MKTLYQRFCAINWKQGNGAAYMSLLICIVATFMMVLLTEYSNINYARELAASRSDMIADSAAVYAQSFDYKYNKSQVETMVNLLTVYNNEASTKYALSTSVRFPADDTLTVESKITLPIPFSKLAGQDYVIARDSSTVKSIDVYGNIFVIP